jgi:hypothetical protein
LDWKLLPTNPSQLKAPARARTICQAYINETVNNEDVRKECVTADSEVASLVLNDKEGDETCKIISSYLLCRKLEAMTFVPW